MSLRYNKIDPHKEKEEEEWVECKYCKLFYPVSELTKGMCKNDIGACNLDHVCHSSGRSCGWVDK